MTILIAVIACVMYFIEPSKLNPLEIDSLAAKTSRIEWVSHRLVTSQNGGVKKSIFRCMVNCLIFDTHKAIKSHCYTCGKFGVKCVSNNH